jgi:Xylose isomerase-like TIM barrel
MAATVLDAKAGLSTRRSRRISHSAYLLSRRIGVSSWSFRNYFPSTRSQDYGGRVETFALLDFPRIIADRYKVHNLELAAMHFASTEPAYVDELRSQLIHVGSRVVCLSIDIKEVGMEGGLSDPHKPVRDNAVETAKKWIDIAAHLRSRSVRCEPGTIDPLDLAPTIDSYKQLVAYSSRKGVRVIVENNRGISSEHPEVLVKIFKSTRTKYLGSLPDFGNFQDPRSRARGLSLLFPYALTVCHANGLDLSAQGNETDYNFAACVEIAKQERFRGVYAVDYEGSGDPYQGVQSVIDELLRNV